MCSRQRSRRDALGGLVDRRKMHLGDPDEALVGLVLEHHHAFHREIRRVDLQDQPGLVDRAVFLANLAGERLHVGLVRVVVRVHQRGRDDAGRRRGHELLGERAARVLLEARDLVVDRAHVGVLHVGDRLRGVGDLGAMHEAPAERRDQIGMLDEILADAALASRRHSRSCAPPCRSGTRRAAARRHCRCRCRRPSAASPPRRPRGRARPTFSSDRSPRQPRA